jgi:hypothetical protein
MDAAIKLQHQTMLVAVEVRDVGADRVLAAKLQSGQSPVAQELPRLRFGAGRFAAELSGTRDLLRIVASEEIGNHAMR